MCVCVCVHACVRARMRACMRACVRVCLCASVCVRVRVSLCVHTRESSVCNCQAYMRTHIDILYAGVHSVFRKGRRKGHQRVGDLDRGLGRSANVEPSRGIADPRSVGGRQWRGVCDPLPPAAGGLGWPQPFSGDFKNGGPGRR